LLYIVVPSPNIIESLKGRVNRLPFKPGDTHPGALTSRFMQLF
jgi:hypothetical protein